MKPNSEAFKYAQCAYNLNYIGTFRYRLHSLYYSIMYTLSYLTLTSCTYLFLKIVCIFFLFFYKPYYLFMYLQKGPVRIFKKFNKINIQYPPSCLLSDVNLLVWLFFDLSNMYLFCLKHALQDSMMKSSPHFTLFHWQGVHPFSFKTAISFWRFTFFILVLKHKGKKKDNTQKLYYV